MSTLVLKAKKNTNSKLLLRRKSDRIEKCVAILRIDIRKETIRTRVVQGYALSSPLFRRCNSRTYIWRTAYTSLDLRFDVGLKNHSNKTPHADLPYLKSTVITSTTTKWHLCICAINQALVRQFDVTSNKHNWWWLDDHGFATKICSHVLDIWSKLQ